MAKAITDAEFQAKVLDSDLPVLVDFWAPWCGPCQMIGPVIDQVAEEYQGKCEVYKCNVDENNDTATKFGIMGIPAIKIFKSGEIVDEIAGAVPKEKIVEKIEKHL